VIGQGDHGPAPAARTSSSNLGPASRCPGCPGSRSGLAGDPGACPLGTDPRGASSRMDSTVGSSCSSVCRSHRQVAALRDVQQAGSSPVLGSLGPGVRSRRATSTPRSSASSISLFRHQVAGPAGRSAGPVRPAAPRAGPASRATPRSGSSVSCSRSTWLRTAVKPAARYMPSARRARRPTSCLGHGLGVVAPGLDGGEQVAVRGAGGRPAQRLVQVGVRLDGGGQHQPGRAASAHRRRPASTGARLDGARRGGGPARGRPGCSSVIRPGVVDVQVHRLPGRRYARRRSAGHRLADRRRRGQRVTPRCLGRRCPAW